MRKGLNFNWNFLPHHAPMAIKSWIPGQTIDIPHSNTLLPYNYVNEADYQFESTYQVKFNHTLDDQLHFIHFEGVGHYAQVFVNGHYINEHFGGYTAFSFEITDALIEGENLLTVFVDSQETLNVPPFGNTIDFLTFGGIYREVYLSMRPKTYITDAFIHASNLLTHNAIRLALTFNHEPEGQLSLKVTSNDGFDGYQTTLNASTVDMEHTFHLSDLQLWDIDHPHLYNINITYTPKEGNVDTYVFQTGFREAYFTLDGFYLNGKKRKLIGLNRHQSFPYVGDAMPKSAQVEDARILKQDLGLNCVRTSHYPQSKHFIEACDALGLLVFEEIPGWQHIGDHVWKQHALIHTQDMILRDRNNPSVILWGVRINESGDDSELYEMTNKIAHDLDPSRQTAGVRFIPFSQVQEDVFTLNDFIHEGENHLIYLRHKHEVTQAMHLPYLVTEHSGHMYPTKSFDHESKRKEHAKMHAFIVNQMIKSDDILGVIGWCMHDYNTHKDFGSGDRICYHGVLDAFRNTKLAAYFYSSQQDNYPVLEPSSHFHIGDYPKGYIPEVLVFSNCDEVEVYRNEHRIGKLKKHEALSALNHPPFVMDWFGDLLEKEENLSKEQIHKVKTLYHDVVAKGETYVLQHDSGFEVTESDVKLAYHMYGKYVANWGSRSIKYTFKGYINDTLVLTKVRGSDVYNAYKVYADRTRLEVKDTYDTVRITVEHVNEHDTRLVYSNQPFLVNTEGPIEVIGPKELALLGGVRSFWIKTTTQESSDACVHIAIEGQRFVIDLSILKGDNA